MSVKPCEQCGRLFEVAANNQRFCTDKVCKATQRKKLRQKYREEARKKHAGAEASRG